MSWTRGQVERLILLVSERPYLFDPRNSLYKNKGKRLIGFREIAEGMIPARPNTTSEECRKKWYSLRTNYLAERRKVISSKKSGVGVESVYVPSLFYFNELSFIDEYTSPRESISTLDEEAEDFLVYEDEIPVVEEGELEGAGTEAMLDLVFVDDDVPSNECSSYSWPWPTYSAYSWAIWVRQKEKSGITR
ncbi:uncharacterized protein LOC124171559 [Ischnura elegans]|uniref:uncharacterized protein LOC124171559 n=1 Tax=Ischnura elegans TaxID=197161 RepID=UPI001ED8B8B5|nr:uncharacterized protein LOC124171559 [Ischnura elegans]